MREPKPVPSRPLSDFIASGVMEELTPTLREDALPIVQALMYPKHTVVLLGSKADEVHILEYMYAHDSTSVWDDTLRIEVHGRAAVAGDYTLTVRRFINMVLVAAGTLVGTIRITPIPE